MKSRPQLVPNKMVIGGYIVFGTILYISYDVSRIDENKSLYAVSNAIRFRADDWQESARLGSIALSDDQNSL